MPRRRGVQRCKRVSNREGTCTSRDFGWEIAHAAVSRRPPISLSRIAALTESYTHDAGVWDLLIVQEPVSVSVAPCQSFAYDSQLFLIAVRGGSGACSMGRRTEDDERQLSRWRGVAGEKGRWKNALANKIIAQGRPFDGACLRVAVSGRRVSV